VIVNNRKWNGKIRSDPANDNYGRPDDLPPGMKPRKATSTRKEYATAPAGPEEFSDGYYEALLRGN
jgi:hypothetical protein